jgi:CDP-paratose 2-epimerase
VDLGWLEVMGRAGVLEHVDVVGLHGFPGTWDPEACWWSDWPSEVAGARETCERYRPDLEFWITEAGYATGRHDEAEQARRFLDALAAPVERVYWYSLHDFAPDFVTQEGRRFDERHYHTGLYDAHGRPKLLARLLEEAGPGHVAQTLDRYRRVPSVARVGPVLVTGGAGFIGANLADRLCREGHHVHVVDSLARSGVQRNLRWLQDRHPASLSASLIDVRETDALAAAGADATAVFHLAGQVAVTTALADPSLDFEVNLQATFGLLRALARRPVPPPLVFASTNKVYGELADLPLALVEGRWLPRDPLLRATGIDEGRGLDFHTPYGCSKGAADQYVLDHARHFGLPAVVMRMSCVYGPHQLGTEDQGWVAHFLIRAMDGLPITLFGDGRQVRDIIDVADVVGAFLAAWKRIDRVGGEAFNLGGGPANAVSLLDVLDAAADATSSVLEVRHAAPRPGDQRWYVSDTRKARARLQLPPPRPWREGVGALAAWLRETRGGRTAARHPEAVE